MLTTRKLLRACAIAIVVLAGAVITLPWSTALPAGLGIFSVSRIAAAPLAANAVQAVPDSGQAAPPAAAPFACSGGANKTGDPPNFNTGQITFCPNVSTVTVCDYFSSVSGGCPGTDHL